MVRFSWAEKADVIMIILQGYPQWLKLQRRLFSSFQSSLQLHTCFFPLPSTSLSIDLKNILKTKGQIQASDLHILKFQVVIKVASYAGYPVLAVPVKNITVSNIQNLLSSNQATWWHALIIQQLIFILL